VSLLSQPKMVTYPVCEMEYAVSHNGCEFCCIFLFLSGYISNRGSTAGCNASCELSKRVNMSCRREGIYGDWSYNVISAVDGVDWKTSGPGHFATRQELRYPFSRRLCGPRNGLGCLKRRKISCPCREWNRLSSLEPSHCTIYTTPALFGAPICINSLQVLPRTGHKGPEGE
jgi:hypothetical protein